MKKKTRIISVIFTLRGSHRRRTRGGETAGAGASSCRSAAGCSSVSGASPSVATASAGGRSVAWVSPEDQEDEGGAVSADVSSRG